MAYAAMTPAISHRSAPSGQCETPAGGPAHFSVHSARPDGRRQWRFAKLYSKSNSCFLLLSIQVFSYSGHTHLAHFRCTTQRKSMLLKRPSGAWFPAFLFLEVDA